MAAVKRTSKKTGEVSYVGGSSLSSKQQAEVSSGKASLGYGYSSPSTGGGTTGKRSYDEASKNLDKGGLSGDALARARDVLSKSYSTATQVNDPNAVTTDGTTPEDDTTESLQGETTGEEYYSRYSEPTPSFEVESPEVIQRRLKKEAQAEINSLRDYERSLLDEQAVLNQKDAASTRATNVLSGLAGGTEADISARETDERGAKANERIRSTVELQVQGVLSNIRKEAVEEARWQRQEARADESAYYANLEARQKSATTHLTNLTASGVTFDGLRKNMPKEYEYLARMFGGEQALKGAFVLNTPQDQILDKGIKGGSYYIARQNPITGKVSVETVDLGLPPEYTKTVDAGDRILAIPDGWDGDPAKLLTINKGLTPSSGGGEYGGYNKDQNTVISRVDDKVSKNATYVKTNNMRGYVDNVNTSLSQETGTGDLAAINQFQKVIDEGAVTRDQDVKLIQNSQSLLNKLKTYEKNLLNGEQLSPELRSEMKTAVNAMYEAQVKALNKDPFIQSKKGELERYGIDPNDTIIGELGAFSTDSGSRVLTKDGESFDASDLTEEEYQAAINDGYAPE